MGGGGAGEGAGGGADCKTEKESILEECRDRWRAQYGAGEERGCDLAVLHSHIVPIWFGGTDLCSCSLRCCLQCIGRLQHLDVLQRRSKGAYG